MRLSWVVLAISLGIVGCTTQPPGVPLPPTREQREAQIEVAAQAVKTGKFEQAEQLLSRYLYRSPDGELLFRSMGVGSDAEQMAIDTVALMLWETGRDASLESFSKRYLSGYERDVMLCRLAERNAVYEKAYNCWNDLGDVDRARRTVRTESALRILKD
ncbi:MULTISPECIES: hypothetical protein [Pseudomonas]|uniref:hypothetical protein n=1 Tax=Pseudomonas TaxID=286 RepID=UPI00070D4757|nr:MULTISPECIES: hypothetical protein [Pseudomonas]KQW19951.1 hypothetical protein ASC85_08920 [Pseudomonas sp. Root401]PWC98992.1 hypothetical protein CX658_30920 [Pseudomonas amygdali pv. lachrymans]WHS57545.1 hypothetical protein QLH64_29790 [Pseudomonas brassicacearum]WNZ87374.1 hypothetical protein QOM10_30960 [Pseudomonas sp. P108]